MLNAILAVHVAAAEVSVTMKYSSDLGTLCSHYMYLALNGGLRHKIVLAQILVCVKYILYYLLLE